MGAGHNSTRRLATARPLGVWPAFGLSMRTGDGGPPPVASCAIVVLGNAKLYQAYQPPMSALPLLVGMAGIFPEQGLDPGIWGGHGTPQRSSRT